MRWLWAALALALLSGRSAESGPVLSDERIVFQTRFGTFEMAVYPEVRGCDPQDLARNV